MAVSYDNTDYELQGQLDLLNLHAITNKGAAFTSNLYKITTNSEGHVTSATAVVKSDITALGIPGQDTVYTLPVATSSTRGGITLGYTSSGKNYAVQVDSDGNAYVNVPWSDNDTTYSAGTGLSLNSTTFSLATVSGLTAGSYGNSSNQTPAYGGTFNVPYITVDSYGRVTSISNKTVKIPASDNTDHYAWSDITGKPSYYDAKAIKSITRSGTTFTYTCLDNTTGTFTQQDKNTTYSFSDKDVTLAWGTKSTIATVGGTDIHVTMPANPNTWPSYTSQLTNNSGFITGITGQMVTNALGYTPINVNRVQKTCTFNTSGAGSISGLTGTPYIIQRIYNAEDLGTIAHEFILQPYSGSCNIYVRPAPSSSWTVKFDIWCVS